MSLVEVLIVAGLLALLGTLFTWFMIPSLRLTAQQSVRIELQQQATIALAKLTADLRQTSATGVSLGVDSMALNLIEGVTDEGKQIWADEVVVYYRDASLKRLFRKVYPPAPPALNLPFNPLRPTRVSPSELASLATSNGQERSAAQNVEVFEIAHSGEGDNLQAPLTLRLVLTRGVSQKDEDESFEIVSMVALRN